MTIQHPNGAAIEALLLSETGNAMRIAVRGASDVVELTRVNQDIWITPECEPIRVSFEPPARCAAPSSAVEDFLCPPDLAAYLIGLLHATDQVEVRPGPAPRPNVDQLAVWSSVN